MDTDQYYPIDEQSGLPGVWQRFCPIGADTGLNLLFASADELEPDPQRVWDAVLLRNGVCIGPDEVGWIGDDVEWCNSDSEKTPWVMKVKEAEFTSLIARLRRQLT